MDVSKDGLMVQLLEGYENYKLEVIREVGELREDEWEPLEGVCRAVEDVLKKIRDNKVAQMIIIQDYPEIWDLTVYDDFGDQLEDCRNLRDAFVYTLHIWLESMLVEGLRKKGVFPPLES